MKLLTASGLLYSAVQSQTVDGHYGAFPEIDWMVQFAESASTMASGVTTTGTSLGINPGVRQIETTFDGGKLITGNGSYTGTVTFGWMLKLFGTTACAVTTVSVPTSGYNLWTVFKITA